MVVVNWVMLLLRLSKQIHHTHPSPLIHSFLFISQNLRGSNSCCSDLKPPFLSFRCSCLLLQGIKDMRYDIILSHVLIGVHSVSWSSLELNTCCVIERSLTKQLAKFFHFIFLFLFYFSHNHSCCSCLYTFCSYHKFKILTKYKSSQNLCTEPYIHTFAD